MAKGSGTTRASGSRNPQGLNRDAEIQQVAVQQMRALNEANPAPSVNAIHKTIDRAGFKSSGVNGQWELDTPYGGAQILDETDSAGQVFGYKEYGVSVWDKDYNMIEDGQTKTAPRFSSLNEAKRYAKDLIKDKYR